MSVTEDKTNALRAQMGGHTPIVYTLKVRGGVRRRRQGSIDTE